ncbi:hypothetical protein [Cohaesibacter gelatinilyticus]|uniref:Uncharacterized protein n=1 Tax=Cohaesibacter gelatinilyticus TaxID=372072 RepID=A0A285PH01_9HYPH|nr:hypothetical protein [Cohaesibacter gelatinilyticus]SNZ19416.1 hypothetical protein SAMN06265368_2501 [Cohaesibacter gelatinilyticus]
MSESGMPLTPSEGRGRGKKSRPWFKIFVVALVISTIITFIMPGFAWALVLTIVGTPVGLFLLLAPTLLLYLFLLWALHKLFSQRTDKRWISISLSLGVGIGLLAIPPYVSNPKIEEKARQLIAGDHDDITHPVKVKTIALRKSRYDPTECNGFCVYALLSGAAERVLMIEASDDDLLGDVLSYQDGAQYRLVEQENCVLPKNLQRNFVASPKLGKDSKGQTVKLIEELRLRASLGQCLVKTDEVDLEDADLIVSKGKGYSSAEGSRFSLDFLGARWSHIRVHQPDENGRKLKEIYRWTGGSYEKMFPILFISPGAMERGRKESAGWLRGSELLGEGHGRLNDKVWSRFLDEVLQFSLPATGETPYDIMNRQIDQILSENRKPSIAEWSMINLKLNTRVRGAPEGFDEKRIEHMLAILASPHFPLPAGLDDIKRMLAKSGDEERLALMVQHVFERLDNWNERRINMAFEEEGTSLSSAHWFLSRSPDYALQPNFDVIERWLSDPEMRAKMRGFLHRLPEFGEPGRTLLIEQFRAIIQTGVINSEDDVDWDRYWRALRGLCKAGEAATQFLPELEQMILDGKVPLGDRSLLRQLMDTHIRLGGDPDMIWGKIEQANAHREDLDDWLRRLEKKRAVSERDCN